MKYKYPLKCVLSLDGVPSVDKNNIKRFIKPLKKCTKARILIHVRKNKNLIVKLLFENRLHRDWLQLNLVSILQDLKLNKE